MKEGVELFRLRAIRGSGVALGLQETVCNAGSGSHRDSVYFSCFLLQNRDFEVNFWWNLTKIGGNSSLSCPLSIAHTLTRAHTRTHSLTHTHTLTWIRRCSHTQLHTKIAKNRFFYPNLKFLWCFVPHMLFWALLTVSQNLPASQWLIAGPQAARYKLGPTHPPTHFHPLNAGCLPACSAHFFLMKVLTQLKSLKSFPLSSRGRQRTPLLLKYGFKQAHEYDFKAGRGLPLPPLYQ